MRVFHHNKDHDKRGPLYQEIFLTPWQFEDQMSIEEFTTSTFFQIFRITDRIIFRSLSNASWVDQIYWYFVSFFLFYGNFLFCFSPSVRW